MPLVVLIQQIVSQVYTNHPLRSAHCLVIGRRVPGVGVRGRVRVGAVRSGVVATGERLVMFVATSAYGCGLRVVRRAYVVRHARGERTSACRHFGIGESGVAIGTFLTTEEATAAATRSVVVGRAWAEALLLLVMTGEGHLNESRNEEQGSSGDGDGKASRVHFACAAE